MEKQVIVPVSITVVRNLRSGSVKRHEVLKRLYLYLNYENGPGRLLAVASGHLLPLLGGVTHPQGYGFGIFTAFLQSSMSIRLAMESLGSTPYAMIPVAFQYWLSAGIVPSKQLP